jgi:hypothetical protein
MNSQRATQVRTTKTSGKKDRSINPPLLARPPLHPILYLQQIAGNQAVQRLLLSRTIQAKLSISQPSDIYEREADWMAEQAMRIPEPVIDRTCSACAAGRSTCSQCETEKQPLLQRKREQHSDSSEHGGRQSVRRKEESPAKGACGGASLASKVAPSDKRINGSVAPVDLDETSFGNTSKLGADFRFGACKVDKNWRFYLKALVVPIASRVQPETFRINVPSASDAVVTKTSYPDIVKDLSPTATATFSISCGGNKFKDKVTTYSRRKTYWNYKFVVDHEAFHRKNWMDMYRKELVNAESNLWAHSLPASGASDAADAIAKANAALTKYMTDAYQNTCKAYGPKQESDAYDDGAAVPDAGGRHSGARGKGKMEVKQRVCANKTQPERR